MADRWTEIGSRCWLEAAVVLLAARDGSRPPGVQADWFHHPLTRAAWTRLSEAEAAGQPVDLAVVLLDPEAGALLPLVPQVGQYFATAQGAAEALGRWVRREQLAVACRQALQALATGDDAGAERLLAQATAAGPAPGAWMPAKTAALRLWELYEARQTAPDAGRLRYGWPQWDSLTEGLQPGELVVIAARAGIGKTLVAGNLTRHWARQGVGVAYLSLEMLGPRLLARWLAMETGLDALQLARNLPQGPREWDAVTRAFGRVAAWPVWIWTRPVTLSGAVAAIRQAVRQHGARVAIVDYAGLIQLEPLTRDEPVAYQVGRLARALRRVGQEEGIPVLALVQLNRALEGRTNKVPTLADLRDSGEWEAAADAVWLLYRDPERPQALQCLLAKNRDGAAQVTTTLAWDPRSCRLWDPAPAEVGSA